LGFKEKGRGYRIRICMVERRAWTRDDAKAGIESRRQVGTHQLSSRVRTHGAPYVLSGNQVSKFGSAADLNRFGFVIGNDENRQAKFDEPPDPG
jgi:hypothetical protein